MNRELASICPFSALLIQTDISSITVHRGRFGNNCLQCSLGTSSVPMRLLYGFVGGLYWVPGSLWQDSLLSSGLADPMLGVCLGGSFLSETLLYFKLQKARFLESLDCNARASPPREHHFDSGPKAHEQEVLETNPFAAAVPSKTDL